MCTCTYPIWKVGKWFPEKSGFHYRKGKTNLRFCIQSAIYKLGNNYLRPLLAPTSPKSTAQFRHIPAGEIDSNIQSVYSI